MEEFVMKADGAKSTEYPAALTVARIQRMKAGLEIDSLAAWYVLNSRLSKKGASRSKSDPNRITGHRPQTPAYSSNYEDAQNLVLKLSSQGAAFCVVPSINKNVEVTFFQADRSTERQVKSGVITPIGQNLALAITKAALLFSLAVRMDQKIN